MRMVMLKFAIEGNYGIRRQLPLWQGDIQRRG